ncbi:MAG: DUF2163 domain-containing protein [Rickettsiaceae bacterium]
MQNISQKEMHQIIKNASQYTYCFDFTLQDKRKIFLTSSNKQIAVDGNIYQTYSGILISKARFNDSAQNEVILTGVFEDNGIHKHYDLDNAQVTIYVYINDKLYHFIHYYCKNIVRYDLNFELHLASEKSKYNQSIIKTISKTCRANFGDNKCKIDKYLYAKTYDIISIENNSITIDNIDQANGYFVQGEAIIEEINFCERIINHFENIIETKKQISFDILKYNQITLIPGCDKQLHTCCNKFYNAINFRGEPMLPDDNKVKI